MQHHHHRLILSVLHIHLDHDNCMELIALRGASADVQRLAGLLAATKGVKHAQLAITASSDAL